MKTHGQATWTGSWREGQGTISTPSSSIAGPAYTYDSRYNAVDQTSPEELLAAAHAACFNQALANNLDQEELTAETIETTVTVDYGFNDEGRPTIFGAHIAVTATVPGATDEIFQQRAAKAAKGCTISRILTFETTFEASLS